MVRKMFRGCFVDKVVDIRGTKLKCKILGVEEAFEIDMVKNVAQAIAKGGSAWDHVQVDAGMSESTAKLIGPLFLTDAPNSAVEIAGVLYLEDSFATARRVPSIPPNMFEPFVHDYEFNFLVDAESDGIVRRYYGFHAKVFAEETRQDGQNMSLVCYFYADRPSEETDKNLVFRWEDLSDQKVFDQQTTELKFGGAKKEGKIFVEAGHGRDLDLKLPPIAKKGGALGGKDPHDLLEVVGDSIP